MAKTASSPPSPPSRQFLLASFVLKLIAMVVGLPAALLSTMALIGALTDNGYVRFLGALAALLVVPLAIADRLLPEDGARRSGGIVTDVLAISWLGAGFVIALGLSSRTRPLLLREGDRLMASGYATMAEGAYLLAGARVGREGGAEPAASGSASVSASASATPEPPDAGAAPPDAAAPSSDAPDAGGNGKQSDKNPAELFKEMSPAVVTVFVKKRGAEGGGTGFVLDQDGTIATNHHVIGDASAVRVKFQNGSTYEDVELLADERDRDLALLRVNLDAPLDGGKKPDLVTVSLGDSDAIVVGEKAISIGNPLGLEHTLTDGLISSRRIYEEKPWIQFSAPVSPGNSGGPLFNMRGEVIGVTTAIITGYGLAQNLNLAVPINDLKKMFRPTYPGRRKFGDVTSPSQW